MGTAARNLPFLDADAFLRTDQAEFGVAWRYELVRGKVVADTQIALPSVAIILPMAVLYERVVPEGD